MMPHVRATPLLPQASHRVTTLGSSEPWFKMEEWVPESAILSRPQAPQLSTALDPAVEKAKRMMVPAVSEQTSNAIPLVIAGYILARLLS